MSYKKKCASYNFFVAPLLASDFEALIFLAVDILRGISVECPLDRHTVSSFLMRTTDES